MIVVSSTNSAFIDIDMMLWGELLCDGCGRKMGYECIGKVEATPQIPLAIPRPVKCQTCKSLEEIDPGWTFDRIMPTKEIRC